MLKRVIDETRPLEAADADYFPSDKGMPSSHAMSLGFIGTFTSLQFAGGHPWVPPIIAVYALVSLWYRIYVKLHTWQQVVVGSVLGSSNAVAWHTFVLPSLGAWVSEHLLVDDKLPVYMLTVPVLVGAVVVGSLERRLPRWLRKSNDKEP